MRNATVLDQWAIYAGPHHHEFVAMRTALGAFERQDRGFSGDGMRPSVTRLCSLCYLN